MEYRAVLAEEEVRIVPGDLHVVECFHHCIKSLEECTSQLSVVRPGRQGRVVG